MYTCSLLALDPDTGKLKWHFQFTPHDTRDWDATQVPVLLDSTVDARSRKLVVVPNRNGFYYVLDRVTGEFLLAKPFVKQTWAKEIDKKGRPVVNPGQEPTPEGNESIWPGVDGGNNWMSPSYNPNTKLLYFNARNEDEYSVHLRDMSGDLRSFMKSELKDIQLPRKSLMPAYTSLSKTDLENLVAYLSALRPKR